MRSEATIVTKLKYFTLGLLLATALYAIGSLFAQKNEPKPSSATLRIDTSEVGGGAAVVTSYGDALDLVRPAVVSVYSTKFVRYRTPGTRFNDPLFDRLFGTPGSETVRPEQGLGSGVIVSPEGYILTNNHVVEGADEIRVLLTDNRELVAKVIGTDPKTDIAVIKVTADNLPSATLGDSDGIRVGDVVFALGNPLGIGQTATMGIVSATGRRGLGLLDRGDDPGYEDFIQTDAAINMGNSGGALVDARGRLVGINTAIISTTRGNIGIGFSIPINLASYVMHSLIESGAVLRGYLGVNTQDLDPNLATEFGVKDGKGVLITGLEAGGPAEVAGLRRGDVVTEMNGRAVSTVDELRLNVAQIRPGTEIDVKYIRNGEAGELKVVLGQRAEPTAATGEFIEGVTVVPVTDAIRREYQLSQETKGLVVTEVDRRSRYATLLPVGTVIEQVNQQPAADLRTALASVRRGRNVLLVSYRGVYRYLSFDAR